MQDSLAPPPPPMDVSVPIAEPLGLRWSPRRFDAAAELSAHDLLPLLEAARWAPSSGNEQPWRFLIVQRNHPQRGMLEEALTPGNAWAKRASVLIATFAKQTRAKNNAPNRWAEHDTGVASAYLLAQAAAQGLAVHPMGGFDARAIQAGFGVPDEYTPMAVVAIGRYDPELRDPALEEREARPRTRRALEEIAFGGRWGEPFVNGGSETPVRLRRT